MIQTYACPKFQYLERITFYQSHHPRDRDFSSSGMEMNNENTSTVIVNIHGLLGEQDGLQVEFEEELLVEEGEFVLDEVNYQIVRIIDEDVECPIVYVVVLDILRQT